MTRTLMSAVVGLAVMHGLLGCKTSAPPPAPAPAGGSVGQVGASGGVGVAAGGPSTGVTRNMLIVNRKGTPAARPTGSPGDTLQWTVDDPTDANTYYVCFDDQNFCGDASGNPVNNIPVTATQQASCQVLNLTQEEGYRIFTDPSQCSNAIPGSKPIFPTATPRKGAGCKNPVQARCNGCYLCPLNPVDRTQVKGYQHQQ